MKTNLKWLNEYLQPGLDLSEQAVLDLAQQIELTSVELESVGTAAAKQTGLVVVRVDSVVPHPDSDHMVITQVFDGQETIQVVTGAPNVAEGQLVILARVGAQIVDRESGDLVTIKEAQLRGETSYGMLVALQEIGLADAVAPQDFEEGIHVFTEEDGVKPGDDALAVLGLNDPMIDTDLTPNRADLLSMRGMAYELAAMTDQKVMLPQTTVLSDQSESNAVVTVAGNADLATGYAVRVLGQVKNDPSPLWLQSRLWNAGFKPENKIVDLANYWLLLTGQPLHVYDLDKLATMQLEVRLAKEGETLPQGEEEAMALRADQDIVVAAGDQILSLAGIATNPAVAVTADTTKVVVEAGQFNPSLLRQSARRHTLRSESSFRFERGIDLDQTLEVLDQVAAEMAMLTKGKIVVGLSKFGFAYRAPETIAISRDRINQILGTDLSVATISAIFTRLALPIDEKEGQYLVTIPGRRTDLTIPADLIEEVGRLYGYDNLPTALVEGQSTPGDLTPRQKKIRASREIMESLGFDQAISYALTTPEKATAFNLGQGRGVVALDYPMSSDRTTIRQNLLSGLLDDVAYNVARSVKDLALYEQGRIFLAQGENVQPEEREHLAGVLVGNVAESSWQTGEKNEAADFYDIKGRLEAYLQTIGLDSSAVRFEQSAQHEAMHPGQTADVYLGSTYLGFVGQIHPAVLANAKLPAVFAFEIDLEVVIDHSQAPVAYQPVSKYPQISRDLAVLVDDSIDQQQVFDVIKANGGDYLQNVTFFDLYTGQGLPAGKKSLAYQLTYQDKTDTLVESVVTDAFEKMTATLTAELGAEIR
ncbi:tRNA-binding EMAP/Myf domain (EMAP) [Fructobacillus tropaeoli]|uniref:phenylalanine--tRNA ligase subunit beta n=1 Tax=Fructobacillus tropaeoli TaxID=709323 RepID=UPI002D99B2EB|nr:tRNA-binding EMAP/Myf domain (EMAP) [Fructobacillus tropaeoli]